MKQLFIFFPEQWTGWQIDSWINNHLDLAEQMSEEINNATNQLMREAYEHRTSTKQTQ